MGTNPLEAGDPLGAGNPLEAGDPASIGAYELLGRLGSGGMGEVFLGRDPDGRLAAIKAARSELADDVEFRRRFAREVDAARKVDGRFTAAVLDADPEARRPWLATEYVRGVSVTEAVVSGGPLPEDSLRALTAGTAAALAAIHGVGLTHRDLKPSNVLLAEDGPRVIDFGIARSAAHSQITRTGQVPGTPGYMAPEQLRGTEVGPHTDVYALGATVVFAATGEGPFGHGDFFAMIYRTMEQEARVDGVPGSLRAAVARCLSKDPAHRPSVADLQAEFSVPATLPEGRTVTWLPREVTTSVRGAVAGEELAEGSGGGLGSGLGEAPPVVGSGVEEVPGSLVVEGNVTTSWHAEGDAGADVEVDARAHAGADGGDHEDGELVPGPSGWVPLPPPAPEGPTRAAPGRPARPAKSGRMSRRTLLAVSAGGVAGVAVGGTAVFRGVLGDDGGDGNGGGGAGSRGAGADGADPLRVGDTGDLALLLFRGAYGQQFLTDALRRLSDAFPKVKVAKQFTQTVGTRFEAELSGSAPPPDLVENVGADAFDLKAAVAKGDLTDLEPLLEAPAIGSPGKKVRDMLLPGVVDAGRVDGKGPVYGLNYLLTVYGFWYSRRTLRSLGVAYPRTWADLLKVCSAAERKGVVGLVHPGKYPSYLWYAVSASLAKRGGRGLLADLVAGKPDAWGRRAVRDVFEAYHELATRGFVAERSADLTHTDAQTMWSEGKALFIPNGSWVESEAARTLPDDFDLAVGPPPSVDGSDRLPFGTLAVSLGDTFVVPKRAKNPRAAMELLRIALGAPAAAEFAARHNALPAVRGGEKWRGAGLDPGQVSALTAYREAGDNAVPWTGFPKRMRQEADEALGAMMAGRAGPGETIARVRDAAASA
ncbi:serine/threonine-protein kinase [Streptomyces venezuelae]|uniref:serine/threonine-protein kinase n=1 Tax=Streptomyces venezuelae TaxID=54571 RepID=UPI0037ADDDAC